MKFDITVKVKKKEIHKELNNLIKDEDTLKKIHNLFAKTINPWVPMDRNTLASDLEVTSEYVRYKVPYAHYMYIGEVYGPNIPIFQDGVLVGFYSKKGEKKYPTGRPIQYSKDKHLNATKEWDKVAMQTELDSFEEQVKEILKREAEKIYG